MQDSALAADGYGQSISVATGIDSEHGSSGGGFKNRRRKNGITIRITHSDFTTSILQRPVKSLWVIQDSYPIFPPSIFKTVTATPVLRIYTSCYGYALSISVGSKCAILHSLFLYCFNVNMLHMRNCLFSPSKTFTLGSW